jgi:hypothetical protein
MRAVLLNLASCKGQQKRDGPPPLGSGERLTNPQRKESLLWNIIRGCIQKLPDWVDNEIYAYLWYYSLRNNTKVYGGKIR